MKKIHGLIVIGASALVLAACGSSSSNDTPVVTTPPAATSDIPASATADSAGLLAYVNGQVAVSSDTGEALLVGDATVFPEDNTTETSL